MSPRPVHVTTTGGYAVNRESGQTRSGQSLETVIGSKVDVRPDGCWVYGDPDADGYGAGLRATGRVHRFVYETLIGPIPEGHVLHHHCGVKRCCNPAHIEALTPSDHASLHAQQRKESRNA